MFWVLVALLFVLIGLFQVCRLGFLTICVYDLVLGLCLCGGVLPNSVFLGFVWWVVLFASICGFCCLFIVWVLVGFDWILLVLSFRCI